MSTCYECRSYYGAGGCGGFTEKLEAPSECFIAKTASPETVPGQYIDSKDLLSAFAIVKALAAWSKMYPRNQVYGAARQPKIEGELEEIENDAKHLIFGGI